MARLFAGLWAVGVVTDAFVEPGDAVLRPALAAGVLLWCSLTCWLTPTPTVPAPWESSRRQPRPLLVAQLVVLAVAVGITEIWAAVFHGLLAPRWLHTVGLYPIFHALDVFSYDHGWPPLEQTLLYVAIPGALLVTLGARPRDLGVQRGYRALRTTLLWSFAFIPGMLGALIAGNFLHLVAWNGFQNGPVEEFLWRGAILTRVAALWDVGNAVIVSALFFGLWHLDANLPATGTLTHRLAASLALCLTDQALFGLAFGVIFARTRSLLAGSLTHLILDAF